MKKFVAFVAILSALAVAGLTGGNAKADTVFADVYNAGGNLCLSAQNCDLIVYRASLGTTKRVATGQYLTANVGPYRDITGDFTWTQRNTGDLIDYNAWMSVGTSTGRLDIWARQLCVGTSSYHFSDTFSQNAFNGFWKANLHTSDISGCHPALGIAPSPLAIEAGFGVGTAPLRKAIPSKHNPSDQRERLRRIVRHRR